MVGRALHLAEPEDGRLVGSVTGAALRVAEPKDYPCELAIGWIHRHPLLDPGCGRAWVMYG